MEGLKLHSFEGLEKVEGRQICQKCKGSRKFYCYDCLVPLIDQSAYPQVELPIHITVMRHPKEKISKSSIVNTKILSPDCVDVISGPENTPEFDPEETVLIFPREDAIPLKSMPVEEVKKIKKAVLIDCTWN